MGPIIKAKVGWPFRSQSSFMKRKAIPSLQYISNNVVERVGGRGMGAGGRGPGDGPKQFVNSLLNKSYINEINPSREPISAGNAPHCCRLYRHSTARLSAGRRVVNLTHTLCLHVSLYIHIVPHFSTSMTKSY